MCMIVPAHARLCTTNVDKAVYCARKVNLKAAKIRSILHGTEWKLNELKRTEMQVDKHMHCWNIIDRKKYHEIHEGFHSFARLSDAIVCASDYSSSLIYANSNSSTDCVVVKCIIPKDACFWNGIMDGNSLNTNGNFAYVSDELKMTHIYTKEEIIKKCKSKKYIITERKEFINDGHFPVQKVLINTYPITKENISKFIE